MKIRTGFVSNSSSSSFTCDFCRENVAGWDMCLSEAEMVACVNGHVICESHFDKDLINKLSDEESEDWDEEWRYNLPFFYCPMCNFKVVTDDTIVKYLFHNYGLTRENIKNNIRERFGNLDEFNEQIKQGK